MTVQRLTSDWRIPGTGLATLLLLAAAFSLHAHWSVFIQWCLATQITLHRYLVMYLLQLNNHKYSANNLVFGITLWSYPRRNVDLLTFRAAA